MNTSLWEKITGQTQHTDIGFDDPILLFWGDCRSNPTPKPEIEPRETCLTCGSFPQTDRLRLPLYYGGIAVGRNANPPPARACARAPLHYGTVVTSATSTGRTISHPRAHHYGATVHCRILLQRGPPIPPPPPRARAPLQYDAVVERLLERVIPPPRRHRRAHKTHGNRSLHLNPAKQRCADC